MSELRTCRRCKKIFTYMNNSKLCPSCMKQLDMKFDEVRDYLRQHTNASINDIVTDCDVSCNEVEHWLKQERIEINNEDGLIVLVCEQCGRPIKTGRFCEVCKHQREVTIGGLAVAMKTPFNRPLIDGERYRDKMHYFLK